MKREEFFEQVNRSFDILGNPLRFRIYRKIVEEGCECDLDSQRGYEGNCVKAIMKDLRLPQSTVSTYIKDIKDAGLIECKKNGKYVYCKPKQEGLINLKSYIDSALVSIK